MSGYIATIYDKEFANSFPDDIIQLLTLYPDIGINMNQIVNSKQIRGFYEITNTFSISSLKSGYPKDLQFAVNMGYDNRWFHFARGRASLKLTATQTFAAYIELYCPEYDTTFACYDGTYWEYQSGNPDHERIYHNPIITYKCYIDLIPFYKVPAMDDNDRIHFLWIINRKKLIESYWWSARSPRTLQVYDEKRQMMGYYWLELDKYQITLYFDFEYKRKAKKRDLNFQEGYRYWVEVEFDEMTTKWSGYGGRSNMGEVKIYPSPSMQYYNGWLKRFMPTIRCIKLQFQRIV